MANKMKDPFREEVTRAKRLLLKLDRLRKQANKSDAFGITFLSGSTSDLIDIAERALRAAADAVAIDIERQERQAK